MQNNEYVCFLSVKHAMELAKKHEDEDDWDIWNDAEAIAKGMNNIMESAS